MVCCRELRDKLLAPEVNSRSRETKLNPHLVPLKRSHGNTELTVQHRINLRPRSRLLLQSPTQRRAERETKPPPIVAEGTAETTPLIGKNKLVERASRLRGTEGAARSGAGGGGRKLAEKGLGSRGGPREVDRVLTWSPWRRDGVPGRRPGGARTAAPARCLTKCRAGGGGEEASGMGRRRLGSERTGRLVL